MLILINGYYRRFLIIRKIFEINIIVRGKERLVISLFFLYLGNKWIER